MYLNNYNNLLNSGRCSNKDPKDDQILTLVVMDQNITDDSKKALEKPNREYTKLEKSYIRDIPPWMTE